MAPSIDTINAITKTFFIPKLVDQITTSNILLQKVPKAKVSGGVKIRQPIWYAFNTAGGWYSGSETLDTSANEKITALEFDWKQSYQNITMSKADELKNAGESRVIEHVKTQIMIAEESMRNIFGTGMYNAGTTSNQILGLRSFIDTSKTYGGLSQSTYSWLQAQVDSSTTTLSLSAMKSLYEQCSEGPDQPNLLTMTETLFASYWGLLQPQQRYSDRASASAGFKNLLFQGAGAFEDSYCPSNHLFMLNTKYLSLKSHSERPFPGVFEPFQKFQTQDSKTAKIFWMGELICSQPRKFGKFSALTA